MESPFSNSLKKCNGSDSGISYKKPKFTKLKEWVNTGTPDGVIKVFQPTIKEFANFSKYIEKVELQTQSGICKVSLHSKINK
jgi:hypothetical protein